MSRRESRGRDWARQGHSSSSYREPSPPPRGVRRSRSDLHPRHDEGGLYTNNLGGWRAFQPRGGRRRPSRRSMLRMWQSPPSPGRARRTGGAPAAREAIRRRQKSSRRPIPGASSTASFGNPAKIQSCCHLLLVRRRAVWQGLRQGAQALGNHLLDAASQLQVHYDRAAALQAAPGPASSQARPPRITRHIRACDQACAVGQAAGQQPGNRA
jgi:hypothetical protein